MSTLIVVDMQPAFDASRDDLMQERIIRRIRHHNARGDICAALELDPWDGTYPSILFALREGQYFRDDHGDDLILRKTENDGSQIIDLIESRSLVTDSVFEVVGVNTGYCVLATARGILSRIPDSFIRFPVWCCRTPGDDDEHNCTEQLLVNFCLDNPGRAEISLGLVGEALLYESDTKSEAES